MRKVLIFFLVILLIATGVLIFDYFKRQKEYVIVTPVGGIPDSFEWKLQMGPDFDVYNAINPIDSNEGVGVYIGLHSSFDTEGYNRKIKSRLLGRSTSWYISDKDSSIVATTLAYYSPGLKYHTLQMHFWAYSHNEVRLQQLLDDLASVSFVILPSDSLFKLDSLNM